MAVEKGLVVLEISADSHYTAISFYRSQGTS